MYDELIGRLKREVPSGFHTIGSGCLSSDGKFTGTPSVPIMRLANPDGLDAAAAITDLQAQLAQERAKVVEWLRDQADRILALKSDTNLEATRKELDKLAKARLICADAIERGDHVS